MQSAASDIKDFDGLLPLIDARRAGKPFIVDGRNFIMSADGPRSYFGSEYVNYKALKYPEEAKTFRVGDRIYLFLREGIFDYSEEFGDYFPLFTFPVTTEIWPWTSALCGNSYYFCRKGVGVIRHDTISGEWELVEHPHFPNDPRSVTASNGRLIILRSDRYGWSAQDDGMDFEPSLITGAGFQLTSLIGGVNYRVEADMTGFNCFTSLGVLKARFTGAANVYAHRVLSDSVRAISPFAVAPLTDFTTIVLTLNGFYALAGDTPQPWQPAMGEFFKTTVLPSLDLSILNIIRIDYAEDAQYVCVSIGSASAPNKYFKTYVYYAPTDKWSSFDRVHKGFGELAITEGANKGINFGYITDEGFVARFKDIYYVEIDDCTGCAEDLFWRTKFDYDARIENGVHIMPTIAREWRENPISWRDLPTGRYTLSGTRYKSQRHIGSDEAAYVDGDATTHVFPNNFLSVSIFVLWRVNRYQRSVIGLDSFIEIGMMRFSAQEHADEMAMVDSVIVHSQAGSPRFEEEDWLLDFSVELSEDWNAIEPDVFEDWGEGVPTQSDYDAYLRQSNDGRNLIETGEEELVVYKDEGGARIFYPSGFSSIYHALRLVANEPGETFQLKLLSVGGILTGRYEG